MTYTYYDYLEYYYHDYYVDYYDELYNGSYNGTYPTYEEPYDMNIFNPIFFGQSLLCAILAISLMSFIFRHIYLRQKRGKVGTDKIIVVLTVFSLVCHTLHCVIDPFSYYFWYIQYDADLIPIMDLLWDILWFISRASMYLVFMYRYYKIYNASSGFHSTKKSAKYLTFGVLWTLYGFQVAAFAVHVTYYYIYHHVDYGNDSVKHIYLLADKIFIVLDVIICSLMGYLLANSIMKLIVYQITINSNMTNTEAQLSQYIEDESSSPQQKISVRSMSASTYNRQMSLIHTTTRIALTCVISMVTTFSYQISWHLADELENYDLMWFTHTWNIDSIINMLCVYLVMAIAGDHYRILCVDLCKCHKCCLQCVLRLIQSKTKVKLQAQSDTREVQIASNTKIENSNVAPL